MGDVLEDSWLFLTDQGTNYCITLSIIGFRSSGNLPKQQTDLTQPTKGQFHNAKPQQLVVAARPA
jgi:hypothetical protein